MTRPTTGFPELPAAGGPVRRARRAHRAVFSAAGTEPTAFCPEQARCPHPADLNRPSAPTAPRWPVKVGWMRAPCLLRAEGRRLGSRGAEHGAVRTASTAHRTACCRKLREARCRAGHALVTVRVLTGVRGGARGFA